jgi:hypothetical protein
MKPELHQSLLGVGSRLVRSGAAVLLCACAAAPSCGRTEDVLTSNDEEVPGPGLRGEYFSDTELRTFAGVFIDPNLDFPHNALYDIAGARTGGQTFSVRWTGEIFLREGERTLRLDATGGARLSVGGVLLLDTWTSGETASSVLLEVPLDEWRTIRLEFQHSQGDASLQVLVSDETGFAAVGPRDFRQPSAT